MSAGSSHRTGFAAPRGVTSSTAGGRRPRAHRDVAFVGDAHRPRAVRRRRLEGELTSGVGPVGGGGSLGLGRARTGAALGAGAGTVAGAAGAAGAGAGAGAAGAAAPGGGGGAGRRGGAGPVACPAATAEDEHHQPEHARPRGDRAPAHLRVAFTSCATGTLPTTLRKRCTCCVADLAAHLDARPVLGAEDAQGGAARSAGARRRRAGRASTRGDSPPRVISSLPSRDLGDGDGDGRAGVGPHEREQDRDAEGGRNEDRHRSASQRLEQLEVRDGDGEARLDDRRRRSPRAACRWRCRRRARPAARPGRRPPRARPTGTGRW